jgi:signal transduction histidine kinase
MSESSDMQVPYHGVAWRNGHPHGGVSPDGRLCAGNCASVRRLRSQLQVIGAALLTALVLVGSLGVLAILRGSLEPVTAAMVVVGSCVAAVGIAMICALVAARTALAPDIDVGSGAPTLASGDHLPAAPPSPRVVPSAAPSPEQTARAQAAAEEKPQQSPEVFSRIAHRLQAKVARAFGDLDALERRIEDPDLLSLVFSLDHLVTRIRREVENLSVLGGDVPHGRSSEPAGVNQVLRLAVASTEDYQRISIHPLPGTRIHGHVVAELINLLAELLDNATTFTPPQSPKVVLSASRVAAGLAIEIHDRGIGMPVEDIDRVNRLLAGHTDVDLHELLQEGRIGLAVVNKLAPRHDIRVQLRSNIFGGVDAAVVIPHNLLTQPDELYGSGHGQQAQMDLGSGVTRSPASVAAHAQPSPSSRPTADVSSSFPSSPPQELNAPMPPIAPEERRGKRPPLPERRAGTYLRPELLGPTVTARVSPGHNPDLLTDVTRGREAAELKNDEGPQ